MCLSSSNGTTVWLQKPLYMLIEKFIDRTAIVNVRSLCWSMSPAGQASFHGLLIYRETFCVLTKAGSDTMWKLRHVPESISCDSCFSEQMLFNIVRNCFRVTIRLLGFLVVINIIGPNTIQGHMWAPGVIPILELFTQRKQMIEAPNKWYTFDTP